MAENLYNSNHKATTPEYRQEYDRIFRKSLHKTNYKHVEYGYKIIETKHGIRFVSLQEKDKK